MTRKPTAETGSSTAIATTTTPSTGTALAGASTTRDELAGIDLGDDADFDDGLGEVDREDIRVATLTLNAKRVDERGRAVGADIFYNTLDESSHETVNAAFLKLRKSNSWTKYDNVEKKNELMCSSFDRVTGTYHAKAGVQRPCKGCPDAQWYQAVVDGQPKRLKNCSTVYNVFSVDRDTQQLFVIRFKRTSLSAFKSHLHKHHIGRRLINGKRMNYPLFAFGVKLTGKMASVDATYAIPEIEKVGTLSQTEIAMCSESVKALNTQEASIVDRAERTDVDHTSDADDTRGGDASFNPDAYAGQVGEDFVTSTPEPANGNG